MHGRVHLACIFADYRYGCERLELMKIRSMPFVFALLCLCTASAVADTYTWTGKAPAGHSQDWSNVQNWSPSNNVPGIGDTAIIVPVNSSGFIVNLDQNVQVGFLTLISGTIQGTNTLKTFGTFECQSATLAPAGLTINGPLIVDPIDNNHKTMEVDCPTTINGSSTINSNTIFKIGAAVSVINAGTFTLADGGQLILPSAAGATFVNQHTFQSGNAICSSGASVFSNTAAGTVQVNGGATMQFQGTLANSGIFNVDAGGQANISAATALHNGASFTGSGASSLSSGNNTLDGTVTVQGTLQLNGGTPVLTLNGTLEVQSGGNFNWLGGTLTGVGTNVTGTILVDTFGTLLMNEISGLVLRNCLLTNNGTLNWPSSGTVFMGYNAQIVNQDHINISGDGSLQPLSSGSPGFGVAAINNNYSIGNFSKIAGATNSDTFINVPFSGGNVHVYAGKLIFGGGGNLANEWEATGGGVIQFSGGNYIVQTVVSFVNYGPTNLPGQVIMLGGVTMDTTSAFLLILSHASFQQLGGTIFGSNAELDVSRGTFTWGGGTIAFTNGAWIVIGPFATMNISGAGNIKTLKSGRMRNFGTINWVNDNSVGGVNAGDNVVFDNYGEFSIQCDSYLNDTAATVHPVFTNEIGGTITKTALAGSSYIGFKTVNFGIIQPQAGTIDFYQLDDNVPQAADLFNFTGGSLKIDTTTTLHGNIQGSGKMTVSGGGLTVGGTMEADVISVAGDLHGDGTIVLGDAPGTVTILGNNYIQTTNGRLVVPIRGTNAATMDFGQLIVQNLGAATLAGTLEAQITEGYAPPVGATFPFLTSFQRNGTFSKVIVPQGMQLNYTAGGATLVVTGAVPVQILSPAVTNGQFQFGFNTITNRSYTVQYKDDLAATNWTTLTNFTGTGSYWQVPPLSPLVAHRFFRVSNP
jgi:hypothetical protein